MPREVETSRLPGASRSGSSFQRAGTEQEQSPASIKLLLPGKCGCQFLSKCRNRHLLMANGIFIKNLSPHPWKCIIISLQKEQGSLREVTPGHWPQRWLFGYDMKSISHKGRQHQVWRHQTKKLLTSKGHHQHNEKATYRMRENGCKLCIWQWVNVQDI